MFSVPPPGSMAMQQQQHPHSQKMDFWAATTTLTHAMPASHGGIQTATTTATEAATLSLFESIITAYPPILESLLAQISTVTLLQLYHTSRHLRDFLRKYPLAWKTLSFRLPQPAVTVGSPGNETPENRDRQSKAYSFDALLKQIISPNGTRLTSIDLCNTAVTGMALSGSVLGPRVHTLQHLSVRGCKNVSIKYHIVPFLEVYTLGGPWMRKDLALKSLYTYRCRHHRRRPYLPSSLIRRDSDSDPTHQLIEICHQLGIWTDTAWCPTPGGRCFRRKDYHAGRAGPQNMEVWVPFDRLWRSSNRIGPVEGTKKLGDHDGRLWEIAETGQDGEPLGPGDGNFAGEGKHVPVHERRSHTAFVEEIKCAQCSDSILERCESCSVRMHCMGCRKTLCASCAFNRPIPRKRVKTRHFANLAFGSSNTLGGALGQASGSSVPLEDRSQDDKIDRNRFWWAPGATRSPNLMNESAHEDDSSDSEDGGNMHNGMPVPPANREPPKLNMHWCCLEPIFSGGGGIAVLGPGLGGRGADKIRAAPLPRLKEYEDPDFSNTLRPVDYIRELKNNGLYEYVLGEDVDILSYLKQDSLDLQQQTCPRGLCNDCYRSFRWKVSCRACKNPICKEHDFRALKIQNAHYCSSTHMDFYSTGDNESESSETPMSQSHILAAAPHNSSIELSTSNSFNVIPGSDPFQLATSLSFVPVSSARPRSFSVSGVRGRPTNVWSPNAPRAPETIDRNVRRFSKSAPSVQSLFAINVPHQIRPAQAEIQAKKDAERRKMEKLQRDQEERGQADELAGAMYEFFAAVYDDDAIVDDMTTLNAPSDSLTPDLPIPSPDSITVTTEFGVHEEPANLTTITSSGPSSFHTAYDHSDDDDNNVEMTEHLQENIETLHQELAHMHVSPVTHVHAMGIYGPHLLVHSAPPEQVQTEAEGEDEEIDHVNDTGEEADIDTDGFDAGAETTFVDEFGDDVVGGGGGVLTPTTTITA
ncbi:conserved hypothetical protein [Pyrenophora tritici-repentis Pt-1C-BFP]|uniref:Uncharacterized protein n=1 Tax=Pyrenophora tritici-repentis (strain Pt-1C-BFP) TaxID=426418 RepID=B2VYA6_PYRTR|nr:uncharacterized protein PTRG_02396 [Pyrenophora tritici-repentis Pt-1C-BFP]EDU44919.1 conserved hypothetical protein [Pyrenophora tritici-repentis Pt-1C-BFP]